MQPQMSCMGMRLAENGSRAAAMLQTILGHLATAYTDVLFIGMVPMVMVLYVPAPSSASAPMSHSEHRSMARRRVQRMSASLYHYRTRVRLRCAWDRLATGDAQEKRRVSASAKCGHFTIRTL